MKNFSFFRPAIAAVCASLTVSVVSAAEFIVEAPRHFAMEMPIGIADLQDPPVSFLLSVTDSQIASLSWMTVSLRLVGSEEGLGFASEMYVALNRNLGATSILLNEVGVSAEDPVGAYYDGWDVTFADNAESDAHWASLESGYLTGLWQPDGRVDAQSSDRPQMLSVFNGSAGNGDWRLVIGDLYQGGTMRLESWSITMAGFTHDETVPVPEVSAPAWILALAGGGILLRKRLLDRGAARASR